jgi:protein ImuB
LCSEAQPELAGRFEPILAAEPRRRPPADAAVTKPSTGLARPLRLKPEPVAIQVVSVVPDGPPIRFQWNAVDHRIRLCWGPERIETGWWRDRCARRDYYRVETTDGHRFWLFRAIDEGTWFLHGTFD